MSVSRWKWIREQKWIFFKIFFPHQWNIWRMFFDTYDNIFGDAEEYSTICSWMNDIYGWKCGWKMTTNEFFHEHWQQIFFVKTNQKKQDGKNLCWFILKSSSHEMLKSYFNYYFLFVNTKYLQLCSIQTI